MPVDMQIVPLILCGGTGAAARRDAFGKLAAFQARHHHA